MQKYNDKNPERNKMRIIFFDAWKKYKNTMPLETLEKQIVEIILQHPEYHKILDQPEKYIDKDYLPEFGETNPFLHMGLHLSVREQVNTNRPEGIRDIFFKLAKKYPDSNDAEHIIMQCIAENLWQAQQTGQMVNDADYLQQLKNLIST